MLGRFVLALDTFLKKKKKKKEPVSCVVNDSISIMICANTPWKIPTEV